MDTLDQLFETFRDTGSREAIEIFERDGSVRYTYAELADAADRYARSFVQRAFSPGDRIAILAEASFAWVAAALGALKAGGILTPVDVQLDDQQLRHIIDDSQPRFVCTVKKYVNRLSAKSWRRAEILLLDAEDYRRNRGRNDKAGAGDFTKRSSSDIALLLYTSGTTGSPKGVPLTHANVVFQIETVASQKILRQGDRILLPLPLHHVYPLVIGLLAPLALGMTVIFPQSIVGPQIVRAVAAGRATALIGVPRLYRALLEGIEQQMRRIPFPGNVAARFALGAANTLHRRTRLKAGKVLLSPLHRRIGPALRLMASGGAPLDADILLKLEAFGWHVVVGYGLTETSPLLTLNKVGARHPRSAGKAVSGIELRIDSQAAPGGSDELGEVIARGRGVFGGYRNLPDATAAAFSNGWFRTGDLGKVDAHGYLNLSGRASTVIVTESGENIQPDELEAHFASHRYIKEIGIFGKQGRLAAVVAPDMQAIQQHGEGVDFAVRMAIEEKSRTLPSFKRLDDYVLTHKSIARTRLGKIRRHLLEGRFEEIRQGALRRGVSRRGPTPVRELDENDQKLLQNTAAGKTWQLLVDRFSGKRLDPDVSPQIDLGIDSLGWLELTLVIRDLTGIELDEETVRGIETVRDLLQRVAERKPDRGAKGNPLEHPEEALRDDQRELFKPRGRLIDLFARTLFALNWLLVKALFRPRVRGLDKIERGRQYVFTPNHISYIDSFVIAATLGYRRLMRTWWAGFAGILFRNAAVRLFSRAARALPVEHGGGALSGMVVAAEALRRKESLIWYPEGRRSPSGELIEFRQGIGLLLSHYRTDVVPVILRDTDRAMPIGKLPRPWPVHIEFASPVSVDELERRGSGDTPHARIVSGLFVIMREYQSYSNA